MYFNVSRRIYYKSIPTAVNQVFILLSDKHNYTYPAYWCLFDTTTCSSYPLQPSSGRTLVHKTSKRVKSFLTISEYKVTVKQ